MLKNILEKIAFYFSFIWEKDCLLIGTPTHNNIGDNEIAIAERKFLKDHGFSFSEVTVNEYNCFKKFILKHKDKYKIVLLHGGGNLGDEYINEEEIRRDIILNFNDKKIIIFPQTIYFSDTPNGKKELSYSISLYNSHPDLTIFLREKYSYEFAKNYFKNVFLSPDIVLYLRKKNYTKSINSILLLLRKDNERKINDEKLDKVFYLLDKNGIDYEISDMIYKKDINKYFRGIVSKIEHSFIRKYEIVITDRLHGMVFAYLNSRKCIALNNYNNKVKGTYDWIKKDNNIVFFEDINKIDIENVKKMLNSVCDIKNYVDVHMFNDIFTIIRRKLDECDDVIK